MIEITDKKKCSGCSACQQICPRQCITMKRDAEGFLYPDVEKRLCIECNLCQKICPIENKPEMSRKGTEAYVAISTNNGVRTESSSGGIFSLAAEWVLNHGGIVFGAAFDENFGVHHIKVSSIAELKAIRGSKYLQSRIEDTYHEAKKYLDSGSYVLFSGTGCQIAGLKSYLRKEYENLYTIDVLCHGVPSPAVWKRYLREQEQNYESSATEVSFRNKSHGWKNYCVKIKFANGKTYEQTFTDDVFMKLFLSDICLRPSCHDCRFKEFPRVSDLTLGDCWGVDVYFPEMDDDKGTSVVVTAVRHE